MQRVYAWAAANVEKVKAYKKKSTLLKTKTCVGNE